MITPQGAPGETVGERFNGLYAAASEILMIGGDPRLPEPNTTPVESEIAGTPLATRSYLHEGNRQFSHLTTQVSLVYAEQAHTLFSITATGATGANLEDFEPSRVTGFRGTEYNGDYALSRGWTPETAELVLGYLGTSGVKGSASAFPAAERLSGQFKAESDSAITDMDDAHRRIFDIVAEGVQANIEMAKKAVQGGNPDTILAVLGRQFDPTQRVA